MRGMGGTLPRTGSRRVGAALGGVAPPAGAPFLLCALCAAPTLPRASVWELSATSDKRCTTSLPGRMARPAQTRRPNAAWPRGPFVAETRPLIGPASLVPAESRHSLGRLRAVFGRLGLENRRSICGQSRRRVWSVANLVGALTSPIGQFGLFCGEDCVQLGRRATWPLAARTATRVTEANWAKYWLSNHCKTRG